MASTTWRGDAPAVAQINTLTPTAANNQTYTVTINGKSISYTADATATVAEITAGLVALLNASTIPEFAEVTWADTGTTITGTADTAGKPFTNTSSATGAGALVTAITTASAGPNDWSTAGNWSGGAVPVATNDVYIENNAVDILYGLSQAGATLASLNIASTYTGNIGLPVYNSGGYAEYRTTYLTIDATVINIGLGSGSGSGRIKINSGTVLSTVNVFNTGTAAETGLEPFLWKGTNASNALNVIKGSVGVAVFGGETATLTTIRMSYSTAEATDANIRCGSGATLATITQSGGTLETASAVTTKNQTGGTHTQLGTGSFGTLTLDRGTLYHNSSGSLTTVHVGPAGILDFSRELRGLTVSTINAHTGAIIRDPHARVTWTNGIDLERATLAGVTIDVGTHRKITPGTPT